MKWYYRWRLRQARIRLDRAIDDMPPGALDDPEKFCDEIAEWVHAKAQYNFYKKKLGL